MADHRVSDLSYGHLGDASYDIDERQWEFSVDYSRNQIFEQIAPFKQSIPPVHDVSGTAKAIPGLVRSQMKWISRSRPETFPAKVIASAFAKSPSTASPPSYGQLLAVGGSISTSHQPGHRTDPIIAIVGGEARHVLQLIKPDIEYRGWRKQSAVTVPLLDATSRDIGYWVGTGGTIYQIALAEESNVLGSLLAVRQDSMITIFQPMYHEQPVRAMMPSGYQHQYPPSRLSANPVAVLTANACGSRRHADVSFNPFYPRQFSVVDDSGHWGIWDVEGSKRKNSGLELIPGKSGGIYDDFILSRLGKSPRTTDGWHRVLWTTNVSTIVVCNRCHINVFDVKTTPTRLPGTGSLSTKASDWILDVKRSPLDLSHLFVLTTCRIFWIEVIAAGGNKDGHGPGLRVILSYRHFRDVSDETMSLTVLKDDDVYVLVSSANSSTVNFYTFSMASGRAGTPTSSQGSLTISMTLDSQDSMHEMPLTLSFLPAPLTLNSKRLPGPEVLLMERGVKFYQVWALTPSLALRSTLCAMQAAPGRGNRNQKLSIVAPATRISLRQRLPQSRKMVADSFVIPDEQASEEELDYVLSNRPQKNWQFRDDENIEDQLKPGLNWRVIFQQVFMDRSLGSPLDAGLAVSFESMPELLDSVSLHMGQKTEEDTLPMTPLLELSRLSDFSGDLQHSAPILSNFLEMLQSRQDDGESAELVLSDLTACPGISFAGIEGSSLSDLLKVYDQVGEFWMASLPPKVSNLARLSKFKVARKVAIELCLSSIAVSLRMRTSQAAEIPLASSEADLPLYDDELSDSGLLIPPQIAQNLLPEAGIGLPTPSRSPSVYSYMSDTNSGATEHPSISRLRQYAVSIKSQPDLAESTLLAKWPSSPGLDPAQYSWGRAADEDGDEDENESERLEEERRRRRTEKFLNRERIKSSQVSPQPSLMRSGSQPEPGQPPTSSQTVDIPMTQPDRGAFGARSVKSSKKKKQVRRRAAGF